MLTLNIMKVLTLWAYSNWRPQKSFTIKPIKEMFTFSVNLMFTGLISGICSNIYGLLIGKYFKSYQLGLYSQAQRFSDVPKNSITMVIAKVTYPVLSKLQGDDERMREGYTKIIQMTFYIVTPIMIFLYCSATDIFSVILPPKWLPAAEYFRLFCIMGILHPLNCIIIGIIIVKGKSKLYFNLELFKNCINMTILFFSIKYGVLGVLYGQLLYVSIALVLNTYFGGKQIQLPILRQFKSILGIISCSLSIIFISDLFAKIDFNYLLIKIIFQLITSSFVYIFISYIFRVKSFGYAKTIFNSLIINRNQ